MCVSLIVFTDSPMLSYATCNELNIQLLPVSFTLQSFVIPLLTLYFNTQGIINLIVRFDTI